jgi:IS605 OrfB family transposase
MLKDKFGVNDYFANAALREAQAILKVNKENTKRSIASQEAEITMREKKIEAVATELKNKLILKEGLIAISKAIKEGSKLPEFRTYKGSREYLKDAENLIFAIRRNNKEDLEFTLYEFEVQYLDRKIRRLKGRLKQLKYGLNRAQEKHAHLVKNPRKTCFGTKDFFKKQFTVEEYRKNHVLWKDEFNHRRNRSMTISGRKDAVEGNFVFRYDGSELTFTDMHGKRIAIKGVNFPKGQELVMAVLNAAKGQRTAVAWTIEDWGEYYIFKCTVELPAVKYVNYAKTSGVVAIDVNYDHIAWAELNAQGPLIDKGILSFDLANKSSGQVKWLLGNVVKELLRICAVKQKPLVMEDLDTEDSKRRLLYGNKKRNRKLSGFAYSLLTALIESRAYKDGVYVYKINPAYTSQIGKLKYMRVLGLSIHTAAAFAIGRRSLRYKEKVPGCYRKFISAKLIVRHHWAQWRYLSKGLKGVRTNSFYKSIDTSEYKTIKALKESLAN